ncbi:MarC family NAAT transporter [Pseudomonas sp. F1_0610]|uniref:MarC family NAAT transporter n=1 Tax=Pseudomonas sp. F1_0610 TaxID=3114284 RepID=UPI0039C436AE
MTEVIQFLQAIFLGLMMLLPLSNPLTAVVLFLSLSGKMSRAERDQQARLAAFYVFGIMTIGFYAGQFVMASFGISMPGLRIAGGLIVSVIGFGMLFPKQPLEENLDLEGKAKELAQKSSNNIAFVPIAMPGTAGPGALAVIISSAATISSNPLNYPIWIYYVAPLVCFLAISALLWVSLRSANSIMQWLGKSGIDAISRIMGFLLICMGVQFVITGVTDIVHSFLL